MRFNRLVGAEIADQKGYQDYRDRMVVLLEKIGGAFAYDFHTVATHMAVKGQNYNRLFVLSFPDEDTANRYFSSQEYKAIRTEFFDASVADIKQLATWMD